jgi:hypothetical protein
MGLQSEQKGRNMVTRLTLGRDVEAQFQARVSGWPVGADSQLTVTRTIIRYVVVK